MQGAAGGPSRAATLASARDNSRRRMTIDKGAGSAPPESEASNMLGVVNPLTVHIRVGNRVASKCRSADADMTQVMAAITGLPPN